MKKRIQETINLTPHAITVAGVTYSPDGDIARVSASFSPIVGGVCHQTFGEITGLPSPTMGVSYIVSGMVFGATDRGDVFAPATGHPGVVRNAQGHIVSVPCLLSH